MVEVYGWCKHEILTYFDNINKKHIKDTCGRFTIKFKLTKQNDIEIAVKRVSWKVWVYATLDVSNFGTNRLLFKTRSKDENKIFIIPRIFEDELSQTMIQEFYKFEEFNERKNKNLNDNKDKLLKKYFNIN